MRRDDFTQKERPILLNGEMVRAILEGRKTMTRRPVRKQFAPDAQVAEVPATTPEGWQTSGHSGLWWDDAGACLDDAIRCPFGMPGDRLWVRETWGVGSRPDPFGGYEGIEYRADVPYLDEFDLLPCHAIDGVDLSEYRSGWRPSIHMPRWACRITLEITAVRVERLNDIGADDARSEGCPDKPVPGAEQGSVDLMAKLWFFELWEKVNGDGSWAENPWVWVVEFKRIEVAA